MIYRVVKAVDGKNAGELISLDSITATAYKVAGVIEDYEDN